MALFELLVAAVFVGAAYLIYRYFPDTTTSALRWFSRIRWAIAALAAILFALFALSSGITGLVIIGGLIIAVAALYYFAFGLDGAMP